MMRVTVMVTVIVVVVIMMVMEEDREEGVVKRGWYLLHTCALLQ